MANEAEEQQPVTPSSSLHSPEPSGTPTLKARPFYKEASVVGFGCSRREPAALSLEGHWRQQSFKSESTEFLLKTGMDDNDVCKWSDYEWEREESQHKRHARGGQDFTDAGNAELAQATSWSRLAPLKEHRDEPRGVVSESFPPNEGGKSFDESGTGLHERFIDLLHKVSGFSNTDGPDTSILKQPMQQITFLQKKVEELKLQLAEEKRQRQITAQRLADERQEAERDLIERQEHWEAKLKQLQKERYSLSIRLQELETETPRKRVLKEGDTVLLTVEELQLLRQEIKEQESLIQGYQLENEKAIERTKALQAEAKERQKLMAEENASLAAQVANLQLSVRQSFASEGSARNAGTETHARELKLRLENEKLLQVVGDLERKISELSSRKSTSDARIEKPIPEVLPEQSALSSKLEEQAALIYQLEEKVADQEKMLKTQAEREATDNPLAVIPENGQSVSRKAKPMTEQMAHIRSFYIKKVKTLTKQLEEAGKENMKAEELSRANEQHACLVKELREQISCLKDTLKSQDATIRVLRNKVADLEAIKNSVHQNKHKEEEEATRKTKHNKQKLQPVQDDPEAEVAAAKSSEALKKAANKQRDAELEAVKQENQLLQDRLKTVSQELSDLQASCSASPRLQQLKYLKEKIDEMETGHREKEEEWQRILKETQRVYAIEQDMIERKWELALGAKNAEIDRFRVELDAILETAIKIQSAQLQD